MTTKRSALCRALLAAAVSVAAPGPAHAQQSPPPGEPGAGGRTLLFSAEEAAAIRRALAGQSEGGASADMEKAVSAGKGGAANIFVSALVDLGNGQWTVWANGYRISPDHQPPGFRVISVKENDVEIVTLGDEPARFHLRPFQTWRAARHDIVEGIVP
ncbi:hypothetical protein [Telmatospirillum siberiense]|uniref:hypothetical protein n=1 Tax=Telmatospirillum siberiense TaxID=382514 RepID=UPI0018EB332C|nr:hypothetical protein [Telmatospirillum siberiense]